MPRCILKRLCYIRRFYENLKFAGGGGAGARQDCNRSQEPTGSTVRIRPINVKHHFSSTMLVQNQSLMYFIHIYVFSLNYKPFCCEFITFV